MKLSFINAAAIASASTLLGCSGGGDDGTALQFSESTYTYSLEEDATVQGEVSASAEGNVSYTVASAAGNGIFTLNADGSFSYAPADNFFGEDVVQVQANHGNDTATVEIIFTTTPINDAPELLTQVVYVTTSGETSTNLNAVDVDGDPISFSLVSAPEQGELSISDSGEIRYTAETLSSIGEQRFTIAYTDGNISEPIEATINIKASLMTNADKSNHYYSSQVSHTYKTEAIKNNLNDDIAIAEVNGKLAATYYLAGFKSKSETLFNEIQAVDLKASAQKDAAKVLQSVGSKEISDSLSEQAFENYNKYIADKGAENIKRADVTFYLALIRSAFESDSGDLAGKILNQVENLAKSNAGQEYTSTYGNFLTATRVYADDLISEYLASTSEEKQKLALDALNIYEQLIEMCGYQKIKTGTDKGKIYQQQKILHYAYAAERYHRLNDAEKTQKTIAEAMALYGVVGLDSGTNITASEYATNNLNNYVYPLEILSGLMASVYPEKENLAIKALETSTYRLAGRSLETAQSAIFAGQILTSLNQGIAIAQATESAANYYTAENDLVSFYNTLIEKDKSMPNVAITLLNRGEVALATSVLEFASDLLTSEAYLNETNSRSNTSGDCHRLVELYQIAQNSSSAAIQADKCSSLVSRFILKDSTTTYDAIAAYIDLLQIYNMVNDAQKAVQAAEAAGTEIAKLTDQSTAAQKYSDLANHLLKLNHFNESRTYLNSALSALESMRNSTDGDVIISAVKTYNDYILSASSTELETFHQFMLNASLHIENYAEYYASVMSAFQSTTDSLTTRALNLNDEDLFTLMEDIVKMNFYTGKIDTANTLVNHRLNSEADKLSLNTTIATYYALKDDFPGTAAASVDTDHDGLPNFFSVLATSEIINATGLTADDDSDNDGILDSEDASPLLPNA